MGKIIKKTSLTLSDHIPSKINIELNGGLKNTDNQVIHIQTSNWRLQLSKEEFRQFVNLNMKALNELKKYKNNV